MWDRSKDVKLFYAFFVTFGLTLSMHFSNILYFPFFILYILISIYEFKPARNILAGIGVTALVVFLLHLYIPIRQVMDIAYIWPGSTVWTNLGNNIYLNDGLDTLNEYYAYFVGIGKNYAFKVPLTYLHPQVSKYINLLVKNFSWPGLILLIIGTYISIERINKIIVLVFGIFLTNILFFAFYLCPDIQVFFIPSFFVGSIFIGISLFHIYYSFSAKANMLTRNYTIPALMKNLWMWMVIIAICLLPIHTWAENYNEVSEYAYKGYHENVFLSNFLMEHPNSTIITSNWAAWHLLKYYQSAKKINPKSSVLLVRIVTQEGVHDLISLYKTVVLIDTKGKLSCFNNSILQALYPDETSIALYELTSLQNLNKRKLYKFFNFENYSYRNLDGGIMFVFNYRLNCSARHEESKIVLKLYNKEGIPIFFYEHELDCGRYSDCKNNDNIAVKYIVMIDKDIFLSTRYVILYFVENDKKIPVVEISASNLTS